MCEHGNEELLFVPIPASLSYTGEFRWDWKGVDECIAPIVNALNMAGIYTSSSCCGHGKQCGIISLQDGRLIEIHRTFDAPFRAADWLETSQLV